MTDVKGKLRVKLHILELFTQWCDLMSIDDIIVIDEIQYATDRSIAEQCMEELFRSGYIRNTTPSKLGKFYSDDKYELTSQGMDFAEHVSNTERWNKVFVICAQVKDYSEDTALYIYEMLLKKEIANLI